VTVVSAGYSSIAARRACHHDAKLDASQWSDEMTLGELQLRMRCKQRGHLDADVRPAWKYTGASG
jgi:hypothetical protein